MTYIEKLEAWYQEKRASGEVVDIKFAPVDAPNTPENRERMAKTVYEVLTGQVESWPMGISKL